jgi:hypothetical protein
VCQEREISEGVWPGSCRSLVDDDVVLSSSSFTGFSVCPVVYDGRLIAHKGGVSGGPLGDSRQQQQRPPCCARLLLTFFNTSRATRRFHVPTFYFYFLLFRDFLKNKSLGQGWSGVTGGLSISQTQNQTNNPGSKVSF